MNSEKKRQIFLGVAIGLAALFVIWKNWPKSDTNELPDHQAETTVVNAAPTPMSATSFIERAKDDEPQLSEQDIEIRDLERSARIAQLNAIISEANSKASKAANESEKALVEIARINADITNQEKLTRIQLMRAEAESKMNREPLPMYHPPAINTDPRPDPVQKTTAEKAGFSTPVATVILNSISGNGALLTVDGVMQLVPAGGSFNGVKLIKVDHSTASVVVKGIANGRTRTLMVNTNSTRGFSTVDPLIKDDKSQSSGLQLPFNQPIEPLPDYTSVE